MELGSRARPGDDQEKAYLRDQVQASSEEPQYLIKSDKTDHLAMHKGSALQKIAKGK